MVHPEIKTFANFPTHEGLAFMGWQIDKFLGGAQPIRAKEELFSSLPVWQTEIGGEGSFQISKLDHTRIEAFSL